MEGNEIPDYYKIYKQKKKTRNKSRQFRHNTKHLHNTQHSSYLIPLSLGCFPKPMAVLKLILVYSDFHAQAGDNLPLSFGMNLKAQLAARTMFALADRHGDILREGWQNILDCMLQLYRAKMLPTPMVEVRLQDFYKT